MGLKPYGGKADMLAISTLSPGERIYIYIGVTIVGYLCMTLAPQPLAAPALMSRISPSSTT